MARFRRPVGLVGEADRRAIMLIHGRLALVWPKLLSIVDTDAG
jgi:hypothetical protein